LVWELWVCFCAKKRAPEALLARRESSDEAGDFLAFSLSQARPHRCLGSTGETTLGCCGQSFCSRRTESMTKAIVLSAFITSAFAFAGCAAEEQSETTTTTSASERGAIGGASDVGSVESGVGSGGAAAGAAAASAAQPGH
jgi:hypothetical protein